MEKVKDSEASKEKPEPNSRDIVCQERDDSYGWIDSLDKPSLMLNLRENFLSPCGSVENLRRRLKYHMSRKKLDAVSLRNPSKTLLFPFYVVLDFEATCNEVNPPDFPHEIIEFPAVLVSTETRAILDHFQAYVKPVLNPVLTPFCKNLTGISQEQVDVAAEFPEVLEQFEKWLIKYKLGTKNKFAMVTDGPWDMGRFLYGQCNLSNIPYPNFGKKWINLRKCFSFFYKCERLRLQLMLDKLGIEFVGHPHCGLDDATNIARLLLRMIQDGATIGINERIQLRYKLDPPLPKNYKKNSEPSNQTGKETLLVKSATSNDVLQNSYSQAQKEESVKALERLQRDMTRHTIKTEAAVTTGLQDKAK